MLSAKMSDTSGKRVKTARLIQKATLQLATEHGFSSVTTDMIAGRAGISRRTFFNHYKNKLDALAGPRVDRLDDAYDWFERSERPLLQDLQYLVRQVVTDASPDPAVIRNIGKVREDSPDLQPVFSTMIANFTRELIPLLERRLGSDQQAAAHLVSHLVSQAIMLAFQGWKAGNDIGLDQIVDDANRSVRSLVHAFD